MQLSKHLVIQPVFYLFSLVCFSQKITSTTSKLHDVKLEDLGLVNSGDKVIAIQKAVAKRRGAGIDVVQYDINTMNELKRVSLSDESVNYDEGLMKIMSIHGKVYVITRENQGKKCTDMIAVEVDPQALTLGKPKIIAKLSETDRKQGFEGRFGMKNFYYFSVTPGEKTLGIMLSGEDKNFYFSVLDENLNIVWSKVVQVTAYDKIFIKDFAVDNAHNAYLAYTVSYRQKITPKERNHVTVFTADAKTIDDPVDIGENVATSIVLIPTKENTVCAAGTYHDEGEESYVIGTFYVDLSNKDRKAVTSVIPTDVIQRADVEGFASSKQKKYGIEPKKIQLQGYQLEDGTIDLIMEFHDVAETQSHSFGVVGAMVNFRLGKNGTATWIPKHRAGNNSIAASYYALPYKNNMIVFYADNPDNITRSPNERTLASDNYSSAVLVAATVSEDGSLKREQAITKEDSFLALPEFMFMLSPNSLMIPVQNIRGLGGISNGLRWATIKIQ